MNQIGIARNIPQIIDRTYAFKQKIMMNNECMFVNQGDDSKRY